MNRFEQAVCDCMKPTARLLDRTTDPLHRAILLNFWRHVHLEGAGEYRRIVAPDMIVDHPVYRVTWGATPPSSKENRAYSRFTTASAKRCYGTPMTASPSAIGESATKSPSISSPWRGPRRSATKSITRTGYTTYTAARHSSGRTRSGPARWRAPVRGQDQPGDRRGRPSEGITPARVREIHREQLGKLERERGPNFWVLSAGA